MSNLQELPQGVTELVETLHGLGDGIFVAHKDHGIVSWDKGAEKLWGYSRHQALGLEVEALLPPAMASRHKKLFDSFFSGGMSAKTMAGKTREIYGYKANGKQFRLNIKLFRYGDYAIACVDVSPFSIEALRSRLKWAKRAFIAVVTVLAAEMSTNPPIWMLSLLTGRNSDHQECNCEQRDLDNETSKNSGNALSDKIPP